MTKEDCAALRGILAIGIILFHICQYVPVISGSVLRLITRPVGSSIVAVFLFFTGYGLAESFANKPDYCKKFVTHRIIPFFIDCMIVVAIYAIYRYFIGKENSWMGLLTSLTWGKTYVANGWYLQVAMFFYVSLYIGYLIIKEQKQYTELMLFVTLLAYTAVCTLTDVNTELYLWSILGLPIGVVWSIRKQSLNVFVHDHKMLWIIASIFAWAITNFTIYLFLSGVVETIVRMISAAFFVLFCIGILYAIPIKCKTTLFLGKISLELYVIHGLIIEIVSPYIDTW